MAKQKIENGDLKTPEDGLSKEDIQEFARDFKELGRDFKEMQAILEPYVQQQLQKLAGAHLETMLRTQEETLRYLTDPDPNLRRAALQITYRHWNIMLATVFEKMAISDSNIDVRNTAIGALGTCYSRTKDRRIGRFLAAAVRNDSFPDEIRLTAFTSLLRLHGNLDYAGKSPLVPVSLNDIDWAFVDEYYNEKA